MKLVGILVGVCCLLATPLAGNGPITVGETNTTNDYPETVTFEVEATSAAGTITSVEFNLTIRGGSSTLIEPAEFTPAQQVTARFVWKTFRDGVPPGALMCYTWTVRDDAGNKFTTESADYVVTDSRFRWQLLENDDVAMWWYAGDAAFGQRVFDSAARALDAMKRHTGKSLPHRVHVVLYGDDSDFDAWHNYVREWVGGEAYPGMGLTVQIVPPGDSERVERWVQRVIPHEIAHLFFYQVTHTPFASAPPTWLNEGFAQYHEFVSHKDELAWVRRVAKRGELIPLRLLSGSFTGDDERIALMYAESLSAVTFLSERWGDAGLGQLLSAYEAGRNTDEALREATGLDFEEFQQAWWEWLGGQSGMYPTRVPHAGFPTALPFLTPRPLATPVPTQSPTVAPLAAEPPAISPVPTERPTAAPTPTAGATTSSSGGGPCGGALALLGLGAVLGWRRMTTDAICDSSWRQRYVPH